MAKPGRPRKKGNGKGNGGESPSTAVVPEAAAGFEGRETALQVRDQEAGTIAVIAREEASIKAAIIVAKKYPRDEMKSYTRIMKATERPTFAEKGRYAFPRGGTTVEGPSIGLAREMARCWGNVKYGLHIITTDEDWVHIKGYAYDIESNSMVEVEDKFKRLIFRSGRGWIRPDERDLRELINRRGAICVRNAILQLMPPDVVEEAMLGIRRTLTKAAKGEIQQSREQAARRMVAAFSDFGVTKEMIAGKLGHDVELITEKEIVELRGIYQSIADGNSRRDEHFKIPKANGPDRATLDEADIEGGESKEKKEGNLFQK